MLLKRKNLLANKVVVVLSIIILTAALSGCRLFESRSRDAVISGVVTSNDIGVRNVLVTATGTEFGSTITDANGRYSLSVPEGTYTLTLAKPGYETVSVDNYSVEAEQKYTKDFTIVAVDLVNDGFESYAVGTKPLGDWKYADSAMLAVQNMGANDTAKSLKIYNSAINCDFEAMNDNVLLQFWTYVGAPSRSISVSLNSGDTVAITLSFGPTEGRIQYYANGAWMDLAGFEIETWYLIELVADVELDAFDVKIYTGSSDNLSLVYEGSGDFRTPVSEVNRVMFTTSGSTATVYIDEVLLRAKP